MKILLWYVSRRGFQSLISKQDLRDVKLDKNELKTQVYINRGQPMVRLMAETNQGNRFKKDVSADTLIYWYPLYFYYTWSYNYSHDKLVLKTNDNPPQSLKEFLKDHPYFSFKDCVDKNGVGIVKDNRIFKDNFELMNQFRPMGLVDFTDYFNRQDVSNNFKLLDELQTTVWGEAYTSYLKDHSGSQLVNGQQLPNNQYSKEQFDHKVYQYLTDEDKRLLIRIGCGQTMTMKMSDILRAQDE